MTVTGWGVKRESSFSTVNILQEVTVPAMVVTYVLFIVAYD